MDHLYTNRCFFEHMLYSIINDWLSIPTVQVLKWPIEDKDYRLNLSLFFMPIIDRSWTFIHRKLYSQSLTCNRIKRLNIDDSIFSRFSNYHFHFKCQGFRPAVRYAFGTFFTTFQVSSALLHDQSRYWKFCLGFKISVNELWLRLPRSL